MPSQSAASEMEQGKDRILSLLTGEPSEPTPSEPETAETTDTIEDVETLQSDTEAPRILKVPVGDREVDLQILSDDVDPDSLRIGYLAEADYRRKTMELADQRKNTESTLSELTDALETAKSMIQVDLDALENDTELRANDPDEYLRRLDDVQTRARTYQEQREKVEQAQKAQLAQRAAKEQEMLLNSLPGWLDEKAKNEDIQRISTQLSALGYSQDEMADIVDHRMFLLARKAALFDEITSRDVTGKRDRTPPKSTRPGTARTTADVISQQERDIRTRLANSGKVGDAATLFKHIITGGR